MRIRFKQQAVLMSPAMSGFLTTLWQTEVIERERKPVRRRESAHFEPGAGRGQKSVEADWRLHGQRLAAVLFQRRIEGGREFLPEALAQKRMPVAPHEALCGRI